MASVVRGRGPAYDVRPAGEHPVGGFFGICKDGLQGACAGLLTLLGVTHMTGEPSSLAAIHSSVPWLDSFWGALSADGLAGPVELLGGVILFFAARRGIARTMGLLLFIAYVTAYVNGFTFVDMLNGLSNFFGYAAQRVDAATI